MMEVAGLVLEECLSTGLFSWDSPENQCIPFARFGVFMYTSWVQ